jgi:hypothetical protein
LKYRIVPDADYENNIEQYTGKTVIVHGFSMSNTPWFWAYSKGALVGVCLSLETAELILDEWEAYDD